MADAEVVFNNCELEIIVPDTLLHLPTEDDDVEEWLRRARGPGERKQAFFDEKLEVFFVVKVAESNSKDRATWPSPGYGDSKPPGFLLTFLQHLQVILDATYIPSMPTYGGARLPAPPPRSSSAFSSSTGKGGLGVPGVTVPPLTPNPMPKTSEQDKQYIFSEGISLRSLTWGDDTEVGENSFKLMRVEHEKCWFAIYRLSLSVVFIRTDFNDPLLCLTASVTLRDKPLAPSPQRSELYKLIEDAGSLPPLWSAEAPTNDTAEISQDEESDGYSGRRFFEEVNLLEGLPLDSLNGSSETLQLPTTRLSKDARNSYCLPPLSPSSPIVTAQHLSRTLPVLRKSYRRVLELASGFFVRMRTVILPQIVLPGDRHDADDDVGDESTVILSIEVENPSSSSSGFSVDDIEVYLKNERTKIRLIGWGDRGLTNTESVFPLLIRPAEQFYLSYAVSFLRNLDNDLLQNAGRDGFTKTVSFNIIGRPFAVPGNNFLDVTPGNKITYLTAAFLSRWNCLLDLDPRRRMTAPVLEGPDAGPIAVPIPLSPFPVESPLAAQAQDRAAAVTANTRAITSAGTKRHTYAGRTSVYISTPQRPMSIQTSSLGTPSGSVRVPSPLGKLGMKPWTVSSPPPSGQLSPPLPSLPLPPQNQSPPPSATTPGYPFPTAPLTPAFPGYGGMPVTPRPNSVAPSFGQMGSVGLGMDVKRERGALPGIPATPFALSTPRPDIDGPRPMSTIFDPSGQSFPKDFVVSVSLIPPTRSEGAGEKETTDRFIRPLDEFSIEIFIFNQSQDIRTLSATMLDNRRRRERTADGRVLQDFSKSSAPAYMPLNCQVLIGPLRPSACQSVTMRFLALAAGVHTIDNLTLTDVDTGESINLRSVMDFAVLPSTGSHF